MKWLNKYIVNISFIWWLIQGLLLLLNSLRMYCEYYDKGKSIDTFYIYFFLVSISLIIISFSLLVKNRKVVLFLSILLLFYSLFAMGLMGLLFLWWGWRHLLISIIFCLVIPMLNLFFSIKLIINIRKRHINT